MQNIDLAPCPYLYNYSRAGKAKAAAPSSAMDACKGAVGDARVGNAPSFIRPHPY
ncbi:hypothetical protein [Streptomyces prasinus]|uniref:hypothetical protein n=1 Tax=Streptomyces prasinus TaxID=67345 RepID=UPI0036CBBC17